MPKIYSSAKLKVQQHLFNIQSFFFCFWHYCKINYPQKYQRFAVRSTSEDLRRKMASGIFSVENKWNINGPDCWKYYWDNLRIYKRNLLKTQLGGEFIATGGGFSIIDVVSLVYFSRKNNWKTHIQTVSGTFHLL